MKYVKPKLWKGNDLKGTWDFTLKIDGVRMLRDPDGNPISRSGKPLYNLQHVPKHITDAEIFSGDWESTISLVRTKSEKEIDLSWVYPLYPRVDDRLFIDTIIDPPASLIRIRLAAAQAAGYEGLVLHSTGKSLKVKPYETYDVPITGVHLGEGKYSESLGYLSTPMGNVGTGFTDKQRKDFLDIEIGTTIEVACMCLTPAGKLRHPRFVRVREDK